MKVERLRFPGAFGDLLAARLESPDNEPRGHALLAHCFTCSKDLKAAGRISRTLVEHGIATLRFDFTGIGESEGDFAETNFSSNIDDLVAAADFLRERTAAPIVLAGHSLGGAAVLAATGRIPGVRLVATIAAPSDTEHFRHTLLRRAPELASAGEAEILLGGRRFRIKEQLLEDLAAHRMAAAIASLKRPLLVFHSPADATVSISHAYRIFAQASEPKSLISLSGADHLLLGDERDARLVGEVIATFASRYALAS